MILFVQILWRLVAPVIVPILLLFARKVEAIPIPAWKSAGMQIQRYQLPDWAMFAETPDEQLPGGMYEPTVKKIYNKCGWFICAWYWLAWRNVGHGIIWPAGREVESPDAGATKVKIYGPIAILTGERIVMDYLSRSTDQGYWATPRFSIRLSKEYK